MKLFKMIPDLIIIPLCRIINGVFLENIKIVKVIPVHKGGSTQYMINFRPISLLSILHIHTDIGKANAQMIMSF